MKKLFSLFLLLLISSISYSQGLKKIDIEKYYIADSIDEVEAGLPANSVTYRIFAELEEGYALQTIFGYYNTPLIIGSSTGFYNHSWGGDTGDMIDPQSINALSLGFDSWLTIGAATEYHLGVPLDEDLDGSIINKESMKDADGLMEGDVPQLLKYNLDFSIFEFANPATTLVANDGLIGVLGGFKPSTSNNRVLLAQLTTNGELFFQLNLQIGAPVGPAIQYVASNPSAGQIQFDGLSYGTIILNNPENQPDEK